MVEITEAANIVFDAVDETGQVRVDPLFMDSGTAVLVKMFIAASASEVASGVDVAALLAEYERAETGSGSDLSILRRAFFGSEVGSGLEESYLFTITHEIFTEDSGVAVENAQVSGQPVVEVYSHETAQAIEEILARTFVLKDYCPGAVDLARKLDRQVAESGAGAEVSKLVLDIKTSEAGVGSELSSLLYLLSKADSGSAVEASTLLAAMIANDTGLSIQEVLSRLLSIVETGQGEEVVQLIGAVGRGMKVITYLYDYHNVNVFTRAYFKVRVFTARENPL